MECAFPGCESERTARHSLCKEHVEFLTNYEFKCFYCGVKFKAKDHHLRAYLKAPYNFCSKACATTYRNYLPENLERFVEMAKVKGPENLVKYNKSERGRRKSAEVLEKYARPKLYEKWVGTERQKSFLAEKNKEGVLGFNREEFYSGPLSLVTLNSLEKEVTLDDIAEYDGVPGVWAKYGKDPESGERVCLDLAETTDVRSEMRFSLRALEVGRENASASDEYLEEKYGAESYIYKKYREMAKYRDIDFVVVAVGVEDKEER